MVSCGIKRQKLDLFVVEKEALEISVTWPIKQTNKTKNVFGQNAKRNHVKSPKDLIV